MGRAGTALRDTAEMTAVRNPLDAIALIAPSDPGHAWKLIMGFSELMADGTIIAAFDYQALDSSARNFVQQKTGEIKTLARHAAEDIVTIGQALIEVKAKLKHGQFGAWLQAEFGWSLPTATNFMQVARRFGENRNYYEFAPTVLYMLAAPSTPDPAINEAISLLQSGKRVDIATAKDIIRRHRDAQCAAAIDLLIETAPDGRLTTALSKTHIGAVASVAETLVTTGTVNGTQTLAQAIQHAVIEEEYESFQRRYVADRFDAPAAPLLNLDAVTVDTAIAALMKLDKDTKVNVIVRACK